MKQRHIIMLATAAALFLIATADSVLAAGKFVAPVQNSFTLSFDDSASLSPGPTDFFVGGGFDSFDDYDDGHAGEYASWGSFGGNPDQGIFAGVVADAGPGGTGDHAARLYAPSDTGGWFARLRWQVKGLVLGNSSGGTVLDSVSGLTLPVPDMSKLAVTVPVKTDINGADFRVNFDTGLAAGFSRADSEDGVTFTGVSFNYYPGNVTGLVEGQTSPGSRILEIGPTRLTGLAPNTWSTDASILQNENPTDDFWKNASFEPFFFRGPRSFQLTQVGVTFPGNGSTGGQVGEMLTGSWSMTGDDVLKYHEADFNYDQMVDDQDIDLLFEAINTRIFNESLPAVPDLTDNTGTGAPNGRPDYAAVWGVDQTPNVSAVLDEKYGLTKTGANVLDMGDVDELVLSVLGTQYGDLDLDGSRDASDRATLVANLNTSGGWADGDLNGDGTVDDADLAIYDAQSSVITGDYDNSGQVGQGDLDLVLLNWGDTAPPVPAGWVNQQPVGLIGQVALDGVLLNWGNTSLAATAAVPEPSALALLMFACTGMLLGTSRRA